MHIYGLWYRHCHTLGACKMKSMTSFFCAFIFSLGLGLSGMTHPENVIGFLDITGHWKPALMLVMVGAILVYAICYQLSKRLSSPVFHHQFELPKKGSVDRPLIVGSALFGIGWGIGGYCPGPAIASLAVVPQASIFVLSMALGVVLYRLVAKFVIKSQ